MRLQRLVIFLSILCVKIKLSEGCNAGSSGGSSCSPGDCEVNEWSNWSTCSATCGTSGIRKRTRNITRSCNGDCSSPLEEESSCPNTCCQADCQFSWLSWSPCSVTCGYGQQRRFVKIFAFRTCGGKHCPFIETKPCGDGRCCPVHCKVGNWGSWGSCNAACERSGQRTRTRPITTRPTCGGTGCPSTTDRKACSGPCCRRNCVLSSWSPWTKCSSGSCAVNSGTRSRSRRVITAASCGGTCSGLTQSPQCTPTPIRCLVSTWGSWQSCVASNGRCGGGTQKRVRNIIVRNYCSPSCPSTQESRSCIHSCCPVNCLHNNWQSWTSCSTTCGRGTITRRRTVAKLPSCGGQACGSLTQTRPCDQYNNANCIMGSWSAWSVCDNDCGQGRARKTRRIVKKEVCRGTKCGVTQTFKICTDYRSNRNCVVGQWTSWGKCDQTCSVGTKQRTRGVTVIQHCRGNRCPALKESAQCGSPNNGCQHKCTNGVCSCNPGYNLVNNKQCVAKDCGPLRLTYCAPGTHKGTTCLHGTVSCPNTKTSFPVTCAIVCRSTYAVKGASSVSCTAAGTWSSTAGTYCRRINDPPTQILLSGAHSVSENLPRNTLVGVLSSVDPNAGDSHSYSLMAGGEGKFVIRGNNLYTADVFDYETMTRRYDLTIRSTDNGSPSFFVNKIITISLSDVNERPTNIQLSNYQVKENSDSDIVVGRLSTMDQDTGQLYSYTIKNTASGRFKIDGNTLKVALSNKKCLENGGNFCSLNYESKRHFTIIVRSTDNGSPSLSVDVTLSISLTDVNDKPRHLSLRGNRVRENAIQGQVIGEFSAQDEDNGQVLTYSLSEDDNGRFGVYPNGTLYKVNATDYEKEKTHFITAIVRDNGIPRKTMERSFLVEVLDVNEPPVAIHLDDDNGQLSFPRDHAQIKENSNLTATIGTLKVTDNDVSQKLKFNLDNNASGIFSISGVSCSTGHANQTICSARLLVSGDIDYEISRVLEMTVRVTDQHGSFKIQNFNISVVDVNERPSNVTISGSVQASVPENSAAALVGELVTSDEDDGQNHSYTLLDGSGVFEIFGNKVYLNTSLDFENKNNYVIRVTSTDTGTPPLTSTEQTFLINVLDQSEAPTQITLSDHSVPENKPAGTIIGDLTIKDPDNYGNYSSRERHSCRLSDSAQGRFRIVTKNGQNSLTQAAASLDYEKSKAHKVSVVCSDPSGLSLETSFNVVVLDVNEAPTQVILSITSVSENVPPTVVGILSTQDPDNAKIKNKQTFKYSISSTSVGSSPFVVDGDLLKTTRILNYETARSWTVVVRAQDNGRPHLYRDETIVVDVVDKNDIPTAIQLSIVQVKENSNRGTIVGKLVTNDEDVGQNHTYQMIDSASGRFKVVGDSVMVGLSNVDCLQYGGSLCALNYEDRASYNITLRTTDNGNPTTSFDQTFEIFLIDVNDQPRDLGLSNNQVKENSSKGFVIGSFSARDEDVRQILTFSLTDDDGGRFAVNGKGDLITAKAVDYETVKRHVIRAQVMDNGYDAKKFERNITIEVLDINEAPIALRFTGVQFPKVLENATKGSIVGTLLAQDSDANQNLQFQLDDDSDGAFSLVHSSSQCQSFINSTIRTSCTVNIVLAKRLNYEKSKLRYIIVRATDNHGSFRIQRFPINVTDCNDAPTDITLSGGTSAVVNENAKGVFVGELETSDEDSSQSWNYKLLQDAGGLFRILGSKIYVSENRSLDYEKESVHIVNVRSIDNGWPPYWITRNFTIVVMDLNEQPTNITLSRNVMYENSPPGTVISHVTVEDPDNTMSVRQHHSCIVIGQNHNKFSINNNGSLVSTVILDHERTPSVNVTIECTDDGSTALKFQKQFTVIIVDVNEAPVDVTLSSLNVRENLNPEIIATLSTIDPDNSVIIRQRFVYQLISCQSLQCPFVIDSSNLSTTRKLDHETKSSWNLTIQSTDTGNPRLTVERNFVINIQDVNEAPTSIHLTPNIVDENPNKDALVGTLSTADEDQGQSHRYTLLNDADGRFKLVNNADIRIAPPNTECLLHGGKHCRFNYETQPMYSIRVRSADDGSPPRDYVVDLNITLRNVNDQPRDLSVSDFLVKENSVVNTSVGYFTASDEDGQELSYSLPQNTHGVFAVTKTGRLFVVKSVDHEKLSAVVITAMVTDNGSPRKWMKKQFTIIIQNVNEAPVNTTLTSAKGQQKFPDDLPTIEENSPVGTIVGTLVSHDPDAVQSLNFTLDDSSGGYFIVDTSSVCHNITDVPGVKTSCSSRLYVNKMLDYESLPHHSIIVRVTDPYGHFHVSGFTVNVLDENDKPTNVTLQGSFFGQINENRNDEMIGDLVTSDEDLSQSHSYTLRNSSLSKFTLKGSRLYTTRTANLDYEEQQEFEIVVASTDDGSPPKTVEQPLTIQVQDVNERPTNITLSKITVNENSPEGTFIANITVSDPDNLRPSGMWQTHRCILLDSDQDRFKISNSNQLLVYRNELNFERDISHDIVMQCTDSAARPLAMRKSFRIDVLDINERPLQIILSNNVIPENLGPSYVGGLSSIDPDNEQIQRQTFTYSLVDGNEGSTFFIHGNSLRTNRSLDYEKRSWWELVIKTRDSRGLTLIQNFTINIRDTNDRPTDIITNTSLTVAENSDPGTPIAVFSAIDEDAGQTHRFYINDVSAYGYNSVAKHVSPFFSLDSSSGRLLVTSPVDFENFTQFIFVVVTEDSGYPSLSFNKTFVLNVRDVNEPPTSITLDGVQIAENSVEGSVVGNLYVLDPDNAKGDRQQYDCEVVNDVPFKVLYMKLAVADPILNFEDKRYYAVKVNCSEKGNASFHISRKFDIVVTDVNERPFNLSLVNIVVKENQPKGTLVGTITAQDPDNDDLVFKFSDITTNSTKFSINETSLYTSTVFDYENQSSYLITLMAIDNGKLIPRLNVTGQFNVKILDLNDVPEKINFYSSGVYENAKAETIIGQFSTVDQDHGQSHVYRLLDHTDAFKIHGNQLLLNGSGILDFEKKNLINISVLTTDNGLPYSKSRQEFVQVSVLDVNERPYNISTFNNIISVKENTQGQTRIVFDIHDPDKHQKHNCSLTKGMEFFKIDNKNTLQVKHGSVLDYESSGGSIDISLLCSDNGTPSKTINNTFTITIIDVNEQPTNIWLNGSLYLTELVQNGDALGLLVCQDPDGNQTHSFQVLGKYNDTFNVTKNKNILTVLSNKKLDYENLDSPNITIEIMAMDDGNPSLSLIRNLSLTIKEVNEGTSKISLTPPNVTLNETEFPGRNISELTCNNPEKWQTVEYTLFSNVDTFTIKTINYSVIYKHPILTEDGIKQSTFQQIRSFLFLRSNLSYDNASQYDILVRATDSGNPPLSFNDTVDVRVAKVDPCVPENNCHENGTCKRLNGFHYSCSCNNGFTGDGYNCTDIDDCYNISYCNNTNVHKKCSPCNNNGICVDHVGHYNCSCQPGFNGTQCEHNIDECKLNLSHHCHNGSCNDAINNITCSCYRGYEQWLCDRDINNCINEPCGKYGKCIDGVDSYSCDCDENYIGTRCDRHLDVCHQHPCLHKQYCIPYLNVTTKEKEPRGICFSGENITTIYLAMNLSRTLKMSDLSLADVKEALKIALEDWFLKNLRVLFVYLGKSDPSEDHFYNVTDVIVLDNIITNTENISVPLIARVGEQVVSERGLVCSLHYLLTNCSYHYVPFTSNSFSYVDYLCPTVEDIKRFECIDLKTLQQAFKQSSSKLRVEVIYTLAVVGGVLFIAVIGFALYGNRSHKFNMQKAMRRGQQYDHVRLPEEDDENYRDVMFRHHNTTTMDQPGAVNPIYNIDIDEDDKKMFQNPLYTSTHDDSPSTNELGFRNPLYDIATKTDLS